MPLSLGGTRAFTEHAWKRSFQGRYAGAGPRRRETTPFPFSSVFHPHRYSDHCLPDTCAAAGYFRNCRADCNPHPYQSSFHGNPLPMQYRQLGRHDLDLCRSPSLEQRNSERCQFHRRSHQRRQGHHVGRIARHAQCPIPPDGLWLLLRTHANRADICRARTHEVSHLDVRQRL